jgi:hypothetical protein
MKMATRNPGALRRIERRVQKDTGQGFLVRPSQNHSKWLTGY